MHGTLAAQRAAHDQLAGTPDPVAPDTLVAILTDLEAIAARLAVFRGAVSRLGGDHELTDLRLEFMASNVTEAMADGRRARHSLKAGS